MGLSDKQKYIAVCRVINHAKELGLEPPLWAVKQWLKVSRLVSIDFTVEPGELVYKPSRFRKHTKE